MECQSVSALHGKLKSLLAASAAALLLAAMPAAAQSTTGILLEVWTGISGNQVSLLTSSPNYPNSPNSRIWPGLFEIPSQGDNYGTRARAFIRPPTTGNYTFWLAGDDDSELWLSPNDNAGGITRIANISGWTNSREWTKFASQQSAPISLTAGLRYYIETRHKEGGGGDNLAVGWQGPGITGDAERPIPGSRLTPYVIGTPPAIVSQPANANVNLGQTATFSVTASGAATLTYQWRKNGSNISGATAPSYTTPPTLAGDNGAQFSVVVVNGSGSATSANAILTVNQGQLPVITTQPQNATVSLGQTATFTVMATGSPAPTYQWRKNGTNISDANAPTYTTPATVAGDNGAQFSVAVINAAGTANSVNALLTVVTSTPNNKKIAISGELVDAAGNPLGYPTPVDVDVVVRLMGSAVGGSTLYTEDFRASAGKAVRVVSGLFVARLGEGATTGNLQQVIAANANLWVEITIDDGTPDVLAPRTPLTASAYALGGTPAAAAAGLTGAGNPNAAGAQAAVGATYVNTLDNTTWFKLDSGWKLLD